MPGMRGRHRCRPLESRGMVATHSRNEHVCSSARQWEHALAQGSPAPWVRLFDPRVYFVTACARRRGALFGVVEVNRGTPIVVLNAVGPEASAPIFALPAHGCTVVVKSIVMPGPHPSRRRAGRRGFDARRSCRRLQSERRAPFAGEWSVATRLLRPRRARRARAREHLRLHRGEPRAMVGVA